jgi:hypothetical protein
MKKRIPHPDKKRFRWQVGLPYRWVSQHTSLAQARKEAEGLGLPVYDRVLKQVVEA